MKAYLCFIALIACVLCASRKTDKQFDPALRNEIRAKMVECISNAEGISQTLKNHLEEVKSKDERIPLHFSKVELEQNDREIIKNCKREVFRARRKKEQEENAAAANL